MHTLEALKAQTDAYIHIPTDSHTLTNTHKNTHTDKNTAIHIEKIQ